MAAHQPSDDEYASDLETMAEEMAHDLREGYYANDLEDGVVEAIFEEADTYVFNDTERALNILDSSHNEPDQWQSFIDDDADWREAIETMAFTVVREDLYDELERQGYLDGRQPTEKLEPEAEA